MAQRIALVQLPAIEVLARQPRDQRVHRDERGQAKPDAEVEQWNHGEREQQQKEFVSVHRCLMSVLDRRVHHCSEREYRAAPTSRLIHRAHATTAHHLRPQPSAL